MLAMGFNPWRTCILAFKINCLQPSVIEPNEGLVCMRKIFKKPNIDVVLSTQT
jgi:hypothetical protein